MVELCESVTVRQPRGICWRLYCGWRRDRFDSPTQQCNVLPIPLSDINFAVFLFELDTITPIRSARV
jgi:hypothetical protein